MMMKMRRTTGVTLEGVDERHCFPILRICGWLLTVIHTTFIVEYMHLWAKFPRIL